MLCWYHANAVVLIKSNRKLSGWPGPRLCNSWLLQTTSSQNL